jgi:hypothetical protein
MERRINRCIMSLVQLIRKIKVDRVEVYKHSRIWEAEVVNSFRLYEVLFYAGHIDDDVRQLVYRELDKLADCDAHNDDGRTFAVRSLNEGIACALIVLPCRDRQEVHGRKRVFFIGNSATAIEFYRAAVELGDFFEDEFIDNTF